MKEIIDKSISDMFFAVCQEYNLKTGDISPLDDLIIEAIKEDIFDVLERFVKENE